MKYTSTRNEKQLDSFEQALFSPGYLSEGGLYMPETIPLVSKDNLESWSQLSFTDLCKEVLSLFINEDDLPRKSLDGIVEAAYTSFTHQTGVAPLTKLSNGLSILELFHGKTLAFKDVSMCVLGQLLNYFLEKKRKHVTAVVGTLGDTGSSAIEAVRGLRWLSIVVLLPQGRCSKIQELMMTTVIEDNVHVFAVDGNLNDIDITIKAVSADTDFKDHYHLVTMNSVNIVRLLAQIVLFFWAYFRGRKSCDGFVEVVVPTGGTGSVTAGCLARHMGLPIQLVCAVNVNDIVHRVIKHGDFSTDNRVIPTYASAMDVQVPYNMERIFWMVSSGDTSLVKGIMDQYHNTGKATVPEKILGKMQNIFDSFVANEELLLNSMQRCWKEDQYLICPHTAASVAYYYDKQDRECKDAQDATSTPTVCIATASPVKFPEASNAAGVPIATTPEVEMLSSLPTCSTLMEQGQDWEAMLRAKIEEISAGQTQS